MTVWLAESRRRLFGLPVWSIETSAAADAVIAAAVAKAGGNVVCANAHTMSVALEQPSMRAAFEAAALVVPDGWPVAAALGGTPRVDGPGLMWAVLDRGRKHGLRHFLLGSWEPVTTRLRGRVTDDLPGVVFVGAEHPQVSELDAVEQAELLRRVREADADVLWVGLGAPKQELFMQRVRGDIPCVALGVGAAFDFFAGTKSRAPHWMQRLRLEWAYRLAIEPRRLWRRYLLECRPFFGRWLRRIVTRREE